MVGEVRGEDSAASLDCPIRLQGLGKRYRIRPRGEPRYDTLRDALAAQLRRLYGRGAPRAEPLEDFWALRDVDLEVSRGEVLGIIGRNGAGKSTLLKVLSRITEPTTGRVELDGRREGIHGEDLAPAHEAARHEQLGPRLLELV